MPARESRPDPDAAACPATVRRGRGRSRSRSSGRQGGGAARARRRAAASCPARVGAVARAGRAGRARRELDGRGGARAAARSRTILRRRARVARARHGRVSPHDDLAALAAWNRVGEPRADLVDIKGLEHTRYMVIADAIGVRPKADPDAGRAAARAAARARRAGGRGRARVVSAGRERPGADRARPSWSGHRAPASPTRHGSASACTPPPTGSWPRPSPTSAAAGTSSPCPGDGGTTGRWWRRRMRRPGPWGIWRLDASRETQTFGGPSPLVERDAHPRRRGDQQLDRPADARARRRRDRGAGAIGRAPRPSRAAWSSGPSSIASRSRPAARRGADAASRSAARTSRRAGARRRRIDRHRVARRCRLSSRDRRVARVHLARRRHRSRARRAAARASAAGRCGVIRGGVFGRRLAFGTLEVQRWSKPGQQPRAACPAAFVDIARASRGLPSVDRSHAGGRRRGPPAVATGHGRAARGSRARPARRTHARSR